MFDSLQESLSGAIKTLRGRGTLTEGNMRDGLKLVEQSLLGPVEGIDTLVAARAPGARQQVVVDRPQLGHGGLGPFGRELERRQGRHARPVGLGVQV